MTTFLFCGARHFLLCPFRWNYERSNEQSALFATLPFQCGRLSRPVLRVKTKKVLLTQDIIHQLTNNKIGWNDTNEATSRQFSSWFCSTMFTTFRLGWLWSNEARSRKFLNFTLHVDDSSIRRCDLFTSLTSSAKTYSSETTSRQFLIFLDNIYYFPIRMALIEWSEKQKVPEFYSTCWWLFD